MINQVIDAILLSLTERSEVSRVSSLAKSIPTWSDEEVDELLDRLLDFTPDLEESDEGHEATRIDQLIQPIMDQLVQRELKLDPEDGASWSDTRLARLETLYQHTPKESDLRNHVLRWLATEGSERTIELWTELICENPPEHRLGIVLAFAPLMQANFDPPDWMLEQLLNKATAHSQIAPAIFDLFNFYYREHKVSVHPAESRTTELTDLLGQLSGQLGRIEEGNFPAGFGVSQINRLVSDSVALIVALCDTFAQLKCVDAIGKLHQALGLRHRRVQTEAAAALARLDDEQGKNALIELAEQPVARLRVLAYAEELGFKNDISLELQGEIAIAESHLAIWLAEPEQMGLAPSNIEFLDHRELYWPSYEHPVQCFLFRYSYGSGEQTHSNIGICGPLTHAFAADIQHLSNADIYAAFAGWQTVHNEIYQISIPRAESAFGNEFRHLKGSLDAEAFDELELKTAASFFGEFILIAEAERGGDNGTVIVDSQRINWYGVGNETAPIDWQMAYSIWRGQQLLANFNEKESA